MKKIKKILKLKKRPFNFGWLHRQLNGKMLNNNLIWSNCERQFLKCSNYFWINDVRCYILNFVTSVGNRIRACSQLFVVICFSLVMICLEWYHSMQTKRIWLTTLWKWNENENEGKQWKVNKIEEIGPLKIIVERQNELKASQFSKPSADHTSSEPTCWKCWKNIDV